MWVSDEITRGDDDYGVVQSFGGSLLLPPGIWDELCDYRFRNWVLVAGIVVAISVMESTDEILFDDNEVPVL